MWTPRPSRATPRAISKPMENSNIPQPCPTAGTLPGVETQFRRVKKRPGWVQERLMNHSSLGTKMFVTSSVSELKSEPHGLGQLDLES